MELLRLFNWPLKFVAFIIMAISKAVMSDDSPTMRGCKACGTEKLFCINNTCCPGCEH